MTTKKALVKKSIPPKYRHISSVVTSGLLLIHTAKVMGWRARRLSAFLLMGQAEAFTIKACKRFFFIESPTYFKYVVRDMERKGYLCRIGKYGSSVLYSMTPSGRTVYEQIYKVMNRTFRDNFMGHKHASRI
jgi:hypothetical protein